MELIELKITTSSNEALQMKMFPKEEKEQKYVFKKNNLITSGNQNSKGKTTLIRFLLYALGYEIPLTDGMDFYNYKTFLKLKIKNDKINLIREKKTIYIEKNNKKISMELGKTVNTLLGITNEVLVDNVLGALYIDQEKGWTLLNRGKIIGNRRFNMLDFLVGINSLDELKDELEEIKETEKNVKELKVLEEVEKHNKGFKNSGNILNPVIEEKEKIEKELKELELNILQLTRRNHKLKRILNNNEAISEQIENLNVIIRHKGEEILVTKENLVGDKLEKKILSYQITGNEIKIDGLKKEKVKLNLKLKSYDYTGLNIGTIFNKIDELNLPWKNISELKKIKQKKNNETFKKVKIKAESSIIEYWKILEPILKDLNVSDNYINKEIILTHKLKGKSGTQLHKLTFAFKLACLVMLKEKFEVLLPIIIDSPRSGEVGVKESKLMLNVLKKYLNENQIIIASIYSDYGIIFDNTIPLDNGVVNEIEKFIN